MRACFSNCRISGGLTPGSMSSASVHLTHDELFNSFDIFSGARLLLFSMTLSPIRRSRWLRSSSTVDLARYRTVVCSNISLENVFAQSLAFFVFRKSRFKFAYAKKIIAYDVSDDVICVQKSSRRFRCDLQLESSFLRLI